jgi:hypothetical protein
MLKINSDGAVCAGLAGLLCMDHRQGSWSVQLMTQPGGILAQFQGDCAGERSLTTPCGGMWRLLAHDRVLCHDKP